MLAGDPAMSAMLYTYAYHFHPNSKDIINNYALTLEQIGVAREAFDLLDKLLTMNPRQSHLYFNASRLAIRNDWIDDAIRVLNRGVREVPKDKTLRAILVRTHIELENISGARRAANQYLQAFPDSHEPLELMAEICRYEDDFKGAYAWLKKLRETADPEIFQQLLGSPLYAEPEEMFNLIQSWKDEE